MPSAKHLTLGILTTLALLAAVPGDNPRTPDVAQRPTGYSEGGVPEWAAEPSIAVIGLATLPIHPVPQFEAIDASGTLFRTNSGRLVNPQKPASRMSGSSTLMA